MDQFRRPGELARWAVVLAVAFTGACSHPGGQRAAQDGGAQVSQPQAPFHDGDPAASRSPGLGSTTSAQNDPAKSEADLPFRDSQSLPAGTLLTVVLKNPILAAPILADSPSASSSFDAVVVEPVTVDGDILVPNGAGVVGRVESFRASEVKRSRSSVRLTLDSIQIAGNNWPIQTASLFARGQMSDGNPSSLLLLEKGHRLTFRLAEPVYLAKQQALPGR